MKRQTTNSEDDGSGVAGHSRGDSTDDVIVYDGMGVGDGLDDLDGTPLNAEEYRRRYQTQLRAFARQPARLGSRDRLR